jgi:hypothetical protein
MPKHHCGASLGKPFYGFPISVGGGSAGLCLLSGDVDVEGFFTCEGTLEKVGQAGERGYAPHLSNERAEILLSLRRDMCGALDPEKAKRFKWHKAIYYACQNI